MSAVDRPAAVRAGEELDAGRLASFLRDEAGIAGDVSVSQFPSGYSNLTYALTVGDRQLVLRRPPFGVKPKSGHDMGREYRVLSALQGAFPYAPRPIAFCDDANVIGSEFYVMERLEGIILRRDYPEGLAAEPQLVRAQQERLIDVCAELHQLDYAAAGLGELGRPAGYVDRQLAGWSKRYQAVPTPGSPDCTALAAWLQSHRPDGAERAALVHNDYKLDNVVWSAAEPTRLIGVLDWEMTTLGDPLMDLGCTLAYWIQADDPQDLLEHRMMPTHLAGSLTREEVAERYARCTGSDVGDMDFYYCFGLFRLAVILQQIYYRYHLGQSADPRFATLDAFVGALIRAAHRVAGIAG